MKSLDITRKLEAIAENMKDLEIKGTTQIDWHCLTEKERRLFERVMEIKDKCARAYDVTAATTIEEDQELLKAGFEYVTERNDIKLYRMPKIFAKYMDKG